MQKFKNTKKIQGTSAEVLPQASSKPMVQDCLVLPPRYIIYIYFIWFLTQPCLYSVVFGSMIKLNIIF